MYIDCNMMLLLKIDEANGVNSYISVVSKHCLQAQKITVNAHLNYAGQLSRQVFLPYILLHV